MKSITVVAKTAIGEAAIKDQYQSAMKTRNILLMRTLGISISIINDPFSLKIDLSKFNLSGKLRPEIYADEVINGMESHGAAKDIDYTIEIEK